MRRLIGYWASDSAPRWPDPAAFQDPDWDPGERARVLAHLKAGTTIRAFGGLSWCRICLGNYGTSELADTGYEWPQGLAHYVEAHSVRLPDEFVAHVVSDPSFDVAPAGPRTPRDESWWQAQQGWRDAVSYRDVYDATELWLVPSTSPLTGEQIRFIRSLEAFQGVGLADCLSTLRSGDWVLLANEIGSRLVPLARRCQDLGLTVQTAPKPLTEIP